MIDRSYLHEKSRRQRVKELSLKKKPDINTLLDLLPCRNRPKKHNSLPKKKFLLKHFAFSVP